MITLEQVLAEEKKKSKEEIHPEQKRIEKIISRLDDQRYKDVRQQSSHDGWWDGPDRYQFVNRNIPSHIQRDKLCYVVQALCKHLGRGIGVGGAPIPGVLSVNTKECDIIVTDYHLPLEDESVGYIISNHTIEHIPETADIILNEWCRVLKPGGLIAITIPDKRYFKHENRPDISKYDWAYNEMSPEEFKVYLDNVSDKLELLLFNNNDNGFDIDALLRKKEVKA